MIVDERMVTYIHSLETPEEPIIEQIEQEAKETFVPIIRKETQSFLKVLLLMKKPVRVLEVGTATVSYTHLDVYKRQMQSLAATNDVCTVPVYRPVIGFDKQEIVDIAEKIGTYETSIQPFEDCCTIFVAKHPVTKPNVEVIRRSEEKLAEKIDQLVREAIDTVEVIEVK